MSHAVNLRARQPNDSTKRRKLSEDVGRRPRINGVDNDGLNGLAAKKLQAVPTRDVKDLKRRQQDESTASLGRAQQDAEMMDASEDSEAVGDDEDTEEDESDDVEDDRGDTSEHANGDGSTNDHTNGEVAGEVEPSFGDLLRARDPQTTTVTVTDETPTAFQSNALTLQSQNAPSANSLGTVLTQALRTNDVDLLESCLLVQNLDSIRATIERLDPRHAATLLQKLAERMHKRPGRAGSLMVWIQWTIVAFGGYLAGQPAAMKQLQTLYAVVKQRATGLQPLLALKGKLDMLEAQMQLRRNIQGRHAGSDEGPVIYVEGEEDEAKKIFAADARVRVTDSLADFDDSEDDEDMPVLANGADEVEEDADQPEEEEESEDGDLLDDEAEESEGEESNALSDEVDFDDMDEEEEESDEDEVPPSKRSKPGRA